MYDSYYKLTADPFRLSPDHRFSYGHDSYAEAKAYLEYALFRGEGFIVITGGPGTGKTTLIGEVLSGVDRNQILITTLNCTQLEGRDLLHMVAAAFGLRYADASKATLLLGLEQFFADQTRKGQRCVLIVDEAQGLSPGALEELRLLANLQMRERLLLQIFLVGQEQLRDLVHAPAMEHLSQRIIAAAHLEPLSLEDTVTYIEHRLTRVRWLGDPAISAEALRLIHHYSGGVARRINLICSRLFLHGSMEGKHHLNGEDARGIIEDLHREGLIAQELQPLSQQQLAEAEALGAAHLALPREQPQAAALDAEVQVARQVSGGRRARASAEQVRPMGRKSAWLEDKPAAGSAPPLREAMGRVLDKLDNGTGGAAAGTHSEQPVRRPERVSSGDSASRLKADVSDRIAGKKARPPGRRWRRFVLYAVVATAVFAATSEIFFSDRWLNNQRSSLSVTDDVSVQEEDGAGDFALPLPSAPDAVIGNDAQPELPETETGDIPTSDLAEPPDAPLTRGAIARSPASAVEPENAEPSSSEVTPQDELAALPAEPAAPESPSAAPEVPAETSSISASPEKPETEDSVSEAPASPATISAQKSRLEEAARQRFDRQLARLEETQPNVTAPVTPSVPKTATSPVAAASAVKPSAGPAAPAPPAPRPDARAAEPPVTAGAPAPSEPKVQPVRPSEPKIAARTVPAQQDSGRGSIGAVQLKAALLKGRWNSNNNPATLLPSDITLCQSLESAIECWSVPQNVGTKYGEALYKVEATLNDFSAAGNFNVSYRTLVRLIDGSDDDWQVSEHSMTCKLVSSSQVSCADEKGISRRYNR
ncbi:MAG: AAA family ATPase [Thiogranum sp.]|nr:AAA family ATPase [Thiogranum sp.]